MLYVSAVGILMVHASPDPLALTIHMLPVCNRPAATGAADWRVNGRAMYYHA